MKIIIEIDIMNTKIRNWKEFLNTNPNYIIMYSLSINPNITLSDVISNPKLKWNYLSLTHNCNIPIDYIIETIKKYQWHLSTVFERIQLNHLTQLSELGIKIDYHLLSRNFRIPFSYVMKHKNKDWNFPLVIDYILTEYDYWNYLEECNEILSHYTGYHYAYYFKNLSIGFIYELSKQYGGFKSILLQKANLNFILNTYTSQSLTFIEWATISLSEIITCSDILSHPELPWYYANVSSRVDMTIPMYLYLSSHGYSCIDKLSSSKCITMTDVIENPSLPWKYDHLSLNPNITWQIINNHPDLPWDYECIASNTMISPMECKYYQSIYDIIIKEINYLGTTDSS